MKTITFLFLITLCPILALAQDAYIQVKGEANLSVYLDGAFKCTTSVDLGGCIIEKVSPGQHKIKVAKTGYPPFEEYISVKSGEVFAYTVKPFTKHAVVISEQGNTAETEKKAELSTGKLIIQSVPIEIKITIPQIEGVKNTIKNKDQWIADKLPVGRYPISFAFNNKTITKDITVYAGHTTTVFANMLSGEITTKNSLDEQRAEAEKLEKQKDYVRQINKKFKFVPYLTLNEFLAQCPEAQQVVNYRDKLTGRIFAIPQKDLRKKPQLVPGYTWISIGDIRNESSYGKVKSMEYMLAFTKDAAKAKAIFDDWYKDIKANIQPNVLMESKEKTMAHSSLEIWYNLMGQRISILLNAVEEGWYEVKLGFQVFR